LLLPTFRSIIKIYQKPTHRSLCCYKEQHSKVQAQFDVLKVYSSFSFYTRLHEDAYMPHCLFAVSRYQCCSSSSHAVKAVRKMGKFIATLHAMSSYV